MKIVIIEDEILLAEDLADTLKTIRPNIEIERVLSSVKEALSYFTENVQPDLIFSDIQLGDGLSFEIYKSIEINVPIIFCTAFDEYAIQAFKVNGIEYILKPFNKESLDKAITKFENLKNVLSKNLSEKYESAIEALTKRNHSNNATLMVRFRDRLLPFTFDKIALFYLENELIYLLTHTGRSYVVQLTLDELEKKSGRHFFRMNRQYLVNRNAVMDATDYFPRKIRINLNIKFAKEIIVSREKRSKLLAWMLT